MNTEEVMFRPMPGTTCIAVPHGTDWGFDSLDPAGVEIKAYDGDFVWMIANRTHYITTHINYVTFHPASQHRRQARSRPFHEWKKGDRLLYIGESGRAFNCGNYYYIEGVSGTELISAGVVVQEVGDVFIHSNKERRPIRFSADVVLDFFELS